MNNQITVSVAVSPRRERKQSYDRVKYLITDEHSFSDNPPIGDMLIEGWKRMAKGGGTSDNLTLAQIYNAKCKLQELGL